MLVNMDESGVSSDDTRSTKMGASSNPNSSRIATLQERKKGIEDKLSTCNKELRKLCIEEAELTGVLPVEFPFEPGETPPVFRRRIGTSYELNKNLINNLNNEEEISALELEMQILLKKAEAARDLATMNNGNKTMRRSLMMEYQQHKQKYNALEEKLHDMKMSLINRQQQSSSSVPISNGHAESVQEPAKLKKKPRPEHEVSLSLNLGEQAGRQSRHSLHSYQYSMESVELRTRYNQYKVPDNVDHQFRHVTSTTTPNDHHVINSLSRMSLNGFKEYDEWSESQANHPINVSRTLPHVRKMPQIQYQDVPKSIHSPNMMRHTISPSTSSGSNSIKYYPVVGHHLHPLNRTISNPHQLQPHQQYEQNVMTSGGAGLGGYWKQSENGEVWCASNSEIAAKDKRFGSLDRRKNKRVQKRVSPSVDQKSATLSSVVSHSVEATRTLPVKSQTIASRHRSDHRQLVRTQSLGSVGAITLESTRSDDSTCSDNFSPGDNSPMRKNKPKEWYETSLDTPSPYYSPPPRTQSVVPSIAPEEKYGDFPPCSPALPSKSYAQPLSPKEIPAESNPSSKFPTNRNLEIFNNNIPKNCTVVQQAQWKPYHEETKPFEMADFYKYSTKFKKSAEKCDEPLSPQSVGTAGNISPTKSVHNGFRNLPLSPPPSSQSSGSNRNSDIGNNVSYHGSFEANPLSSPHLAENFSIEMNAWYQKHEHQKDNNNATLV